MLNRELQCWSELLGRQVCLAWHLHGSYGVSAFARQRAESLQSCESLWVKFGNCDPGRGEVREGCPPEDGEAVSRWARRADRPAVNAAGTILELVLFWFRFKSQWTGLWFLFLGYHMAVAF